MLCKLTGYRTILSLPRYRTVLTRLSRVTVPCDGDGHCQADMSECFMLERAVSPGSVLVTPGWALRVCGRAGLHGWGPRYRATTVPCRLSHATFHTLKSRRRSVFPPGADYRTEAASPAVFCGAAGWQWAAFAELGLSIAVSFRTSPIVPELPAPQPPGVTE
eukprot:767406-Hanusia_phi.AAC.6